MALWQPTELQMQKQKLGYQCIRPILRLLHLPVSTNRPAVYADCGLPTLQRYRQQLILRYATRLGYDSYANSQQLNPSLIDWSIDINEYMQQASRLNAKKLKQFYSHGLRPTALEAVDISASAEWNVPIRLLNALYPTAVLLPIDGNIINSIDNKHKLKFLLKQRMHQLTIDDMKAITPKNPLNPNPLRAILTQPIKPYQLDFESNRIR